MSALRDTLNPEETARERWVNERGNTVWRWGRGAACTTCGAEDRYYFDFGPCQPKFGWFQYDTSQDASYFGVWVHKESRETLTLCEGDLTLVECSTLESFRAELADAERCYGAPPPCAITVDDSGVVTRYYDPRPTAN
jgi:hypothetical protein